MRTMAPGPGATVAQSRNGGKNAPMAMRKDQRTPLGKLWHECFSFSFLQSLVFDPARLPLVSVLIVVAELVLNVCIVQTVPYTEIDWKAYMQECEGFLNGTTDYSQLRGDTGPLVYPAGFVYIYSLFYFVTSHGANIRLAQYIFIGIYLAQLALVLRLYCKSRKLPPYVMAITIFTSYRIHSIYVLRLFNDPIAILFLYAALNAFIDNRWTVGSIFLSLGVSVKMNVLLFAPAILLLFITNLGYWKTLLQLAVCALIQLVLGAPFLLTHPVEYLKGSFDLGRVFEHRWTVNYRFLEPSMFENRIFHLALLALHVILLIVFASPCFKYFQNYCRLRQLELMLTPQIDAKNRELKAERKKKKQAAEAVTAPKTDGGEKLSKDQEKFLKSFEKGIQKMATNQPTSEVEPPPYEQQTPAAVPNKFSIHFDRATQLALLPIFLSNFIGIVCARSLHYQFYVWYFHSLPYITWYTEYTNSLKFLLLLLLEFCWNTYPSTVLSSLVLHTCHLILLYGIGKKMFRKIPDLTQLGKAE